jgi:hypothetical protein
MKTHLLPNRYAARDASVGNAVVAGQLDAPPQASVLAGHQPPRLESVLASEKCRFERMIANFRMKPHIHEMTFGKPFNLMT